MKFRHHRRNYWNGSIHTSSIRYKFYEFGFTLFYYIFGWKSICLQKCEWFLPLKSISNGTIRRFLFLLCADSSYSRAQLFLIGGSSIIAYQLIVRPFWSISYLFADKWPNMHNKHLCQFIEVIQLERCEIW